jgi:PIN domain nuclease of toxin-antitoxin system
VKLLLDTHIWLWGLLQPERLSRRVKTALLAPASEIWLSPISVWEALLLTEKGRLHVEGDAQAWMTRALDRMPVREAPVSFEIVRASRRIALSHEDPADRFLAATAHVLDLTLVTADRRLIKLRDVAVLPNEV